MINLNDEIILDIEKVVQGGLALARYEQFVVFVEGALPEEKIKAQIVKLNKKHALARILEIIEPSKHRIKPICPLYNACGSCDNQICDYDYSIFLKTQILKETFKDIFDENKIKDIIKSPKNLCYRKKIQYPAQQTKNSKRIKLGYYKNNSHELIDIKFCPVQDRIIDEITQYLRENFPFDCYNSSKNKGFLKNVVFRITQDNKKILLTFVINSTYKNYIKFYDKKLKEFINLLTQNFSEIKSVYVNFNAGKTNKILSDNELKIFGEDFIEEILKDKKYKISSQSFFQVNPFCAVEIFETVKSLIKDNSTILDAYCGVGAIGIYLSGKAQKITFVEENKSASNLAKENFKLNNLQNCEIYQGDAQKHLLNFEKQKRKFDYAIIDPPRKGSNSDCLNSLSKLTNNIIYVSCNPQTLKRDIICLTKFGYKLEFLQGADLFPYTYHIETVAYLRK